MIYLIKKIKAPIGDENNVPMIFLSLNGSGIKKIKAPIGDENGLFSFSYSSICSALRK